MVRLSSILFLTFVLCLALTSGHPTTTGRSQDPETESGNVAEAQENISEAPREELPPDTFRKLAQALYQRGDKAENRLQRKFFYNDNVTCNDGSVAGFYIRRNYKSKKWVIFLEGGWICHDKASCTERAQRELHRMSSDRWPSVKTARGILSADPEENPHFAEANHVFVPYCSSDSWSGTQRGGYNSPVAFMGHYILREVVRELADFEQLLFHDELFLAGSSAGATGVLVNLDMVADIVRPAQVKVRGIVDSGWFLDHDPFSAECGEGRETCSVLEDMQRGVALWKAAVPKACGERFPGEPWKCYLGYHAFPTMRTPLFIFQWQFDKFQLYADNVQVPNGPDQWNYIHQMGDTLRSTLTNVTATVFSPACIAHEVITKNYWNQVQVHGVTLPDAIECWARSLPDSKISKEDKELKFGKDLEIRAQIAEKFWEDRTNELFNVVPTPYHKGRQDDEDREENRRNSIGSHLSSRRHKKRKNKNRTKANRHRRRHRCRTRSNKCQSPEEIEFEEMLKNGNLVRSLDRRSSANKEKKDGKKEQKDGKKGKKKLTKKERRQKRRERKREKRRQRKARQKRQRAQARKERRRLRKAQQEHRRLREGSTTTTPAPRVRRSATPEPQCGASTKLIDDCSWPHCNPTCPKLKNPETGQEIDFLSLLKSFGLDLSSVAHAMGVDIATLNSMDRELLIHRLTAKPGH